MNYENFYEEAQPLEKALKDGVQTLQRLYKAVVKETDGGDIKALTRDLATMAQSAAALSDAIARFRDFAEGFDTKAYLESGDFAGQMLSYCEESGVNVRGEFPVYEMFPFRVKIDAENQEIYLDRRKVPCVRPKSFVETVRKGQEKLNKASFSAITFAGELSDAYDLAVLKLKKQPKSDVYLANLYKFLAPMGRFRRDYDQQSFAFDLARLYTSGLEETKSGRRFQFGPSRNNNKAFRILDQEGKEQFLATIRFFE